MKKKTLGLIIVLIFFGSLFIPKILSRIADNQTVGSNRSIKPGYTGLDFIRLNGEAKKVPDFLFLNQDSLYVGNEDFLGKVYVAEFFFTRCPSICPIMNKNMKIIYDRFGMDPNFGIASFTIDPKNDTPAVLKTYASAYVDKAPSWQFLTGPKEVVYQLANQGFNIFASINPAVAGGFEHQGYFALIDKEGYIRSRRDAYGNPIVYYMGLDQAHLEVQEIELLIEDIQKLLNEK
jgi:protein SCO1/2